MTEGRLIAGHAATVFIGQIAVMGFGVTDTLVAGRASPEALAALSVGSSIYITVFVALMGVLQALLPILSEHVGANRQHAIGHCFEQGLYICGLLSLLGALLLCNPLAILVWTEVPESLQTVVQDYLFILSWALAPALLFRMFSTLNQSLGHPRVVTLIQVISLAVKIPLSIALALGWGDQVGMGLLGCAWATLWVNLAMLLSMVGLLAWAPMYRALRIGMPWRRPDWSTIRPMLAMGLPNGLALLVEVSSFAFMALFIARMGHLPLAAHQIASNVATLLYMVPLSLSIAISARVSYWIGAEQEHQALAVQQLGIRMVAFGALALALLVWFCQDALVGLYTQQSQVLAMGSRLLGWLALFHLGDAMQALGMFLLRCRKVTLAPLLIYALMLWGLGLGAGQWLAYHGTPWTDPMNDPVAFWVSSSVALALTSITFLWLLQRVTLPKLHR
ncbi:MAG: MATE family efflux transporter [Betaproteobacteria bacterium]|nr:MATE family efflux transporter [Betaproteobacteria bacterium]NBY05789.1 MATE family efflux transporter [Betaproteobacteria bacterium]